MTFMNIVSQLSVGMVRSVMIFALTLLFSLPLGLAVSFGRMSRWAPLGGLDRPGASAFVRALGRFRPIQFLMKAYISIMRGTPLMLQLMVIYFGPFYIFGIKISPSYQFYAVIIAFAINYAAYFAEIYRGGIESMPVGQYEAAKVLGYGRSQTFFRIILPQVMKRIIPSVTNEVITLVKDTSLSMVVAYAEMFTVTKQIASKQGSVLPYAAAALFYYVFNLIVAVAMEKAEKSLSYYQ